SYRILPEPTRTPHFPYTTLFRSDEGFRRSDRLEKMPDSARHLFGEDRLDGLRASAERLIQAAKKLPAKALGKRRPRSCHEFFDADRKSTRLNSSHVKISYAVFCL